MHINILQLWLLRWGVRKHIQWQPRKQIGGRAGALPKAEGDDPAELPKQVLEYLQKKQTATKKKTARDSSSDDSNSADKKKRKDKKAKKKDSSESSDHKKKKKTKKNKKAKSSNSDDEKDKKTKSHPSKKKEKSQTSDDDEKKKKKKKRNASESSNESLPRDGYEIAESKNKKGRSIWVLTHPDLKETVELDPDLLWHMDKTSKGVSQARGHETEGGKCMTLMPCHKIFKDVFNDCAGDRFSEGLCW